MKKKAVNHLFLRTLAIIFILLSCSSERVKNSLTHQNIKGKVKSIEEFSYDVKEKYGELQRNNLESRSLTNFNEKGQEINRQVFDRDNNEIFHRTFNYNRIGEIIDCTVIYGDSKNKQMYIYDDSGNIAAFYTYSTAGDTLDESTFKYNELGNQIEYSLRDFINRSSTTIRYKYNEVGNIIEYSYYDSNGLLFETQSIRYDKFDEIGNWILQSSYRDDILRWITEREIKYF